MLKALNLSLASNEEVASLLDLPFTFIVEGQDEEETEALSYIRDSLLEAKIKNNNALMNALKVLIGHDLDVIICDTLFKRARFKACASLTHEESHNYTFEIPILNITTGYEEIQPGAHLYKEGKNITELLQDRVIVDNFIGNLFNL